MKNIIVWWKIFIFRLLFFTSNEYFSHFNVQQLLSNLSHFVLFSQTHLKITMKTKTFEKIYFIRFYWISTTKVRFILFKLFWIETITVGGWDFFSKKISGGGGGTFIRDLRVIINGLSKLINLCSEPFSQKVNKYLTFGFKESLEIF